MWFHRVTPVVAARFSVVALLVVAFSWTLSDQVRGLALRRAAFVGWVVVVWGPFYHWWERMIRVLQEDSEEED